MKNVKFQVFFAILGPPGGRLIVETKNSQKILFTFRSLLVERLMKCRISMNLAFPAYRLGKKHEKSPPGGRKRLGKHQAP